MDKRLSTREAAVVLGTRPASALALLRGARVLYDRLGWAYLWDRAGVEALARTIRKDVAFAGIDATSDNGLPIVGRCAKATGGAS